MWIFLTSSAASKWSVGHTSPQVTQGWCKTEITACAQGLGGPGSREHHSPHGCLSTVLSAPPLPGYILGYLGGKRRDPCGEAWRTSLLYRILGNKRATFSGSNSMGRISRVCMQDMLNFKSHLTREALSCGFLPKSCGFPSSQIVDLLVKRWIIFPWAVVPSDRVGMSPDQVPRIHLMALQAVSRFLPLWRPPYTFWKIPTYLQVLTVSGKNCRNCLPVLKDSVYEKARLGKSTQKRGGLRPLRAFTPISERVLRIPYASFS